MKFLLYGPSLWARSIKQKFQLEVWNFTVRPEETRLLSYLLYGFRYAKREKRRELLHCLHFPSQFRQDNSEKKSSARIVKEDTCFVRFLAFLTKCYSAKVTRFARGRLPGNYVPLINQSERAYYRSHKIIVSKLQVRSFFI